MRCLRWLWVLALFASLAHAAPPSAPPNVILITLDTTRADRMGFLGSQRGLTPHLDSLARQGVVFTRAYSQVPLTTPSHAAILTGTYPQFNGVDDFGKPLDEGIPYLPSLLRRHGYRTAAFVGSLVLDPLGGMAPGFDRGFDVYDAGFRTRRAHEDRYQTIERRAADVVARAEKWLAKNNRAPFFLWIHLYDAHDPYDPPEPFKTRYASAPYDGEIAYADSAVGGFLDHLRARNLFANSVIAIVADHGEALGDHGESTHGIFLYDETIHVPLLLKLPANRAAGSRVLDRAELVDVLPSLLAAAGLPIPRAVQGRSLLASIHTPSQRRATKPAPAEDRAAYSETNYPRRAFGWSPLQSLRSGKYLYIRAPRPELYDQIIDPAAHNNLAAAATAVATTLAAQTSDYRRKTADVTTASAAPLDPQQAEKLSALGYVASDTTPDATPNSTALADPKDKIEISNLLHDALIDVEEGRYEQAIPRFDRALAAQPHMVIAETQLGIAWARLQKYDKAIPFLRQALVLQPDSGMAHYELGLALFETGAWKEAAPQFESAVARAPRWADAQFSLASVYARIDRVPEAMQALDLALNLSPNHYRANLLRGRLLSLQNDPQSALANLLKAVEVQPDSREAHLFLADAYDQLGQAAKAQQQRERAQQIQSHPPPR